MLGRSNSFGRKARAAKKAAQAQAVSSRTSSAPGSMRCISMSPAAVGDSPFASLGPSAAAEEERQPALAIAASLSSVPPASARSLTSPPPTITCSFRSPPTPGRSSIASMSSTGTIGDGDTPFASPESSMASISCASGCDKMRRAIGLTVNALTTAREFERAPYRALLVFNESSSGEKGVKRLLEEGLFREGSADEIASFFMEHSGKLDATLVGDALGAEVGRRREE